MKRVRLPFTGHQAAIEHDLAMIEWYKPFEYRMEKIIMGNCEIGKCEICGKIAPLERTYFYYPIHCVCCGSKDKDGQDQHFEMVRHCKDCVPKMPTEIHPLLKSMCNDEFRADITNILPSEIRGKFIIDDIIIKHK